MASEWGLIGSLEFAHSPDGKQWRLVRGWSKREVRGVELKALPPLPQLIHTWKESGKGDQEAWYIELPKLDPNATPEVFTLETLEQQLAKHRGRTKTNLPLETAQRLNKHVEDLARLLAGFAEKKQPVGFVCPASVRWIDKAGILLADAGFVWNNLRAAGKPQWLDDHNEQRYRYQNFWDFTPFEINSKLMSAYDTEELLDHDQRVFARIVAWLLLGEDKLVADAETKAFKIPDSDNSRQIERTELFKSLVKIVNDRQSVPWPKLWNELQAHPPSSFFVPPPPKPLGDPTPILRRLALVGILACVGGTAWYFRDKLIPAPPMPLTLCPDCPGTSELREPVEKLAEMWKRLVTEERLKDELALIETVHQSKRSQLFSEKEEACLRRLSEQYDERLLVAVNAVAKEFQDKPPNKEPGRLRLQILQEIAERLDKLALNFDKETSSKYQTKKEKVKWRQRYEFLLRRY